MGVIGRGRGLVARARAAGLDPVVYVADEREGAVLGREGVCWVDRYDGFLEELDHPRVFLVAEEPGEAIDRLIDEAYVVMEPGDVVVDPSGSYWGDTLRRFRRMRHRSLYYVDVAFLDGPQGPWVLAAGDEKGVEIARAPLERLAAPGHVADAGGAGAAHFALALHEGVRTALAHAESEARQLLEAFPNAPRVEEAARALGLGRTPPGARATWLLDDAVHLEAAIPLIAQGVMLEIATALEEHRSRPPPPRMGPFVHPDDIL